MNPNTTRKLLKAAISTAAMASLGGCAVRQAPAVVDAGSAVSAEPASVPESEQADGDPAAPAVLVSTSPLPSEEAAPAQAIESNPAELTCRVGNSKRPSHADEQCEPAAAPPAAPASPSGV